MPKRPAATGAPFDPEEDALLPDGPVVAAPSPEPEWAGERLANPEEVQATIAEAHQRLEAAAEDLATDTAAVTVEAPDAQAAVEAIVDAAGARPTFGSTVDASAYESRNPTFTAGGTAYVRVFCPECSQPMLFAVATGAKLTIDDDERKLQPTFKGKAKVHTCGQTIAELPDGLLDAEDDGSPEVVAPTAGTCPCSECDPSCDTEVDDDTERCVPCKNGEHVFPDTDEEADADMHAAIGDPDR